MSGFLAGFGTTDQGSEYIGIDTTVLTGNDRSAIPGDHVAVTTGPTDLKGGGTLTMAGVSGQTNCLSSIIIDYHGATAASIIVGQIDGSSSLVGGARCFPIPVPIGASLVPQQLVVQFSPPLVAAAANASITFVVPTFGSGAGVANCTMTGYRTF